MRKSGINMEQVKLENRSLIMNCINNNGPISRKDIAEKTGLTAASVTQITTVLLQENILKELGAVSESTGNAGRKKVLLDINPTYGYICSIGIESEYTTIAICDIKGNLVLNKKKDPCIIRMRTIKSYKEDNYANPVNKSSTAKYTMAPEDFLFRVSWLCNDMIKNLPANVQKRLKCISIGLPGIVDKENGISVHAYGIWNTQVPIREILEKELKLDIPIMLENNVDAFATAEILFGAGRTYDSLLVIKWGPGVGSTIVIDHSVYQGRHGKTAELGHFIVEKGGRKCSCGRRGCLETLLSYGALSRIVPFDPEDFDEVYDNSSDENRERIDIAFDQFARSIVNACTLVAPNRIVLAGSLFRNDGIRKNLIGLCSQYDPSYNSNRIIHTTLSDMENYIGPVAVYISSCII